MPIEPEKRFFMLIFRCLHCDNDNRLRDLDIDFLGRFQCSECQHYNFKIKKSRIGETTLKKNRKEHSIVMVEHIHRGGNNGL